MKLRSRPRPPCLERRGKNIGVPAAFPAYRYSCVRLSRNALVITDTELKLIAAAAMIGESSNPENGYSTPAATGTPSAALTLLDMFSM